MSSSTSDIETLIVISWTLFIYLFSSTHYEVNLWNLFLYDRVEFTFVRASGERIKAKGKVGDSLLDVIVNSNLDFDGFGACEGTLTCSTCHLIFSKPDFDKLPDKPSDEELDMLDLAYDLTDTSRLGCQIYLSKDMNGLEVKVCGLSFRFFSLVLKCYLFSIRFQRQSTTRDRKSSSWSESDCQVFGMNTST